MEPNPMIYILRALRGEVYKTFSRAFPGVNSRIQHWLYLLMIFVSKNYEDTKNCKDWKTNFYSEKVQANVREREK